MFIDFTELRNQLISIKLYEEHIEIFTDVKEKRNQLIFVYVFLVSHNFNRTWICNEGWITAGISSEVMIGAVLSLARF